MASDSVGVNNRRATIATTTSLRALVSHSNTLLNRRVHESDSTPGCNCRHRRNRRGWNPVFRNAGRSQKLRERFGPEYDRVVKQEGDPRKAEGVLEFREQRREKFKTRPLSATAPIQFCGSLERSPKRVCRRSPGSGDCCGESGQRGDAGPRISNRRI